MSDTPQPPPEPHDEGPHSEQVQAKHLTARVPDHVTRGVFSTGCIVMTGSSEFILDFVQNVGRPHQINARVVLPHPVLPQFIEALRKNLELYQQRFGSPPELPKPQPGQRRPGVQEIYDELKMPDDVLSGAYANGVMIGHTASEFSFDFITNFFPQSAVSQRVFLAAPQVPRLLDSLTGTFQQYQQRIREQREQQERPPEEGDEET